MDAMPCPDSVCGLCGQALSSHSDSLCMKLMRKDFNRVNRRITPVQYRVMRWELDDVQTNRSFKR